MKPFEDKKANQARTLFCVDRKTPCNQKQDVKRTLGGIDYNNPSSHCARYFMHRLQELLTHTERGKLICYQFMEFIKHSSELDTTMKYR